MKIALKYCLIAPLILLQATTNVWGMDTENTNRHYQAMAATWQNREKFESSPLIDQKYNEIINNQKNFQEKFKGHEAPHLPLFPRKPNFPDTYYHRCVTSTETNPDFRATIVQYAEQTIPLFSQKTLERACAFLELKKINGPNIYEQMTITDFFVRLYTKRPLVCYNGSNGYKIILSNDEGIYVPVKNYTEIISKLKSIGSPQEKSPFTLTNILSLEEAEIGAACGVSSPTFFINNGNRQNQGYKKEIPFEMQGIQIGLVGSNHEIAGFFGCKNLIKKESMMPGDIEITSENISRSLPCCEELIGLYYRPSLGKNHIKDILCNALYEANARGEYESKKVFLHLVAVGLGAWQLFKSDKEDIEVVNFIQAVKEILKDSPNNFKNIGNIDFSWFNASPETLDKADVKNGDTISNIQISFSSRNPSEKLIGENEGKLIVAIYPWDSYAQVGNEYWDGAYSASGDPAAACSSLIPTLQNPYINHFFVQNIEAAIINGLNAKIAEPSNENMIEREITYKKMLQDAITQREARMKEAVAILETEKVAAEEKAAQVTNHAVVKKEQERVAEEQRQIEQALQAEAQRIDAEKIAAAEKALKDTAQAEVLRKQKEIKEDLLFKKHANKTTEQTFIRKLLSHRAAQAIGAIGVIGTLCYLLTTSEQKDCITSRFIHYWERLCSAPTSLRSQLS